MLKRKTVFIVGAGCSKEFDLPVGAELRKGILKVTEEAYKNNDLGPLGYELLRSGIPGINRDLEKRLNEFSNGLYAKASIDQYLDFHQDNPAFVGLGKMALSQALLNAEVASKLNQTSMANGLAHLSGTWLLKLFEVLNEGTRRNNLEDIFQNLSFICFNYDRCIEAFFFWALPHLSGCSFKTSAELVGKLLLIHHPYGTVGDLNLPNAGINPAALSVGRSNAIGEMVRTAPTRIRTFTEGIENSAELAKIHGILDEAERIIFLGFSFLEQNMKLLGFQRAQMEGRTCYATLMGIPDADFGFCQEQIRSVSGVQDVQVSGWTADVFMSNLANTLRRS